MRALWSLVVVCLVAATGVRPDAAHRAGSPAAFAVAAPLSARALATRPVGHPQLAAAEAPDPERRLPPVTAATAFALRPPPPRAFALVQLLHDRAASAIALTRFARGPPVA